MLNTPFAPRDEEARRTISDELDETLFVEAGAGTGKTTSLVSRVVNLVASGRTALDRIAVITFTEAAAAELRDRIRHDLEVAASSGSRSESQRQLCRRGIADLDLASIQTLHSFASALLHERPLEAGLPPNFETTDQIAATLKFDDAWDAWLDSALNRNSALGLPLSLALSLDMRLGQLKDVAKAFHANYDDLRETDFGWMEADKPSVSIPAFLVAGLENLAGRCVRPDAGDRLYDYIVERRDIARLAARGLEDGGLAPPDVGYIVGQVLPFAPGNVGASANWPKEFPPKEVRDSLRALEGDVRRLILGRILGELRSFVLDYAEQRRSEGRAEFHDLLVWACQLLRQNAEVRSHFSSKFTHLLIDESQDTDPLQAEIALLLAADSGEGRVDSGERFTNITALEGTRGGISPKKGKLFVVGDPKQSIYRFRRADVGQMDRLRALTEGRQVRLTQNFRSQRPVTDWVNWVFGRWMADAEPGVQAQYEELFHRWESATHHPFRPRVWALGDEETDEAMDSVREREAADIVSLLLHAVAAPWQVLDRELTASEAPSTSSGQERYRDATFADICILMPVRTGLRRLEVALEDAAIPYRLENASLVFETQEIRDLVNCLKAIDDPADRIAVVAALRSPAFGCSDVELWRHRAAGGSFDYLSQQAGAGQGPVEAALGVLRDFHRQRVWNSVALLVDRFIRDRLLMEAAIGNPRTREQWRRYRFVVEQARSFSQAAEPARVSLRAFIDWMSSQAEENARITETPVPEGDEDAVRIMTVHAAKGLEFPIVVLTGINSGRRGRAERVLFDRNEARTEVSVGSGRTQFATRGYAGLLDRERVLDDAEQVRLMYVAATRARDHLAVSLRRRPLPEKSREGSGGKTMAHEISELMHSAPGLWEVPALAAVDSGRRTVDRGVSRHWQLFTSHSVDHSLEARDLWADSRTATLESAGRPSFVAATALGRMIEDKPESGADEPWRRGRAGTAVGRALHAVMQSVDLVGGGDVDAWARAFAAAEGIPERAEEVAELASRALASSAVKRAVGSGRYWREVPAAMPVPHPNGNGGSLQGFIDLLFEESGELVVVDYKTDEVPAEPGEVISRYRMQGAAYALAVQKATGLTVKEVIFLFPRGGRNEGGGARNESGLEIRLEGLAEAMAETEALAAAALSSG